MKEPVRRDPELRAKLTQELQRHRQALDRRGFTSEESLTEEVNEHLRMKRKRGV